MKNNFKGIKLEASIFASDRSVFEIADIAQSLNIPLLQHAWNTLSLGRNPVPGCYQTDPEDIVLLSKNFPKLKIIIPHLRGIDIRGILSVKNYENIYVDTSGAQPVSGIIEYAVKKIGSERILYGSDVYFPSGRDIPVQLNAVIYSNKNAERIVKNAGRYKCKLWCLGFQKIPT